MKPPVVLLHGWGSHPQVWRTLARALGANVLTPALPGYADTAPCEPYTLERMVDALAADVPKHCVVVGWSLGAQVALTWAQRFPKQVSRLVLVAATPSFPRRSDWPHGATAETLRQFSAAVRRDAPALLRRFVALQSIGDARQVQVAHKLRSAVFTHAAPAQAALEGGLAILQGADLRGALPSIRQPVLVIHGENDAVTPCGAGRALAELLPDARLHVVSGAGHAPFLSDTPGVTQQIQDFCNAPAR